MGEKNTLVLADSSPRWLVSNRLIGRLKLEPFVSGYSFVLLGEDGKHYSLDDILFQFLAELDAYTGDK